MMRFLFVSSVLILWTLVQTEASTGANSKWLAEQAATEISHQARSLVDDRDSLDCSLLEDALGDVLDTEVTCSCEFELVPFSFSVSCLSIQDLCLGLVCGPAGFSIAVDFGTDPPSLDSCGSFDDEEFCINFDFCSANLLSGLLCGCSATANGEMCDECEICDNGAVMLDCTTPVGLATDGCYSNPDLNDDPLTSGGKTVSVEMARMAAEQKQAEAEEEAAAQLNGGGGGGGGTTGGSGSLSKKASGFAISAILAATMLV